MRIYDCCGSLRITFKYDERFVKNLIVALIGQNCLSEMYTGNEFITKRLARCALRVKIRKKQSLFGTGPRYCVHGKLGSATQWHPRRLEWGYAGR